MKQYKYEMNGDVGVEYENEGQWRSYDIEAYGDTEEEFFNNATISEVDQDGGEITCYGLDRATSAVIRAVYAYVGLKYD